jgi:hypothetical protein
LVNKQTPAGSRDAADAFTLFALFDDLPELHSAEAVPAMFEDSTHQIWRCDTADGSMMLKICQHKNLAHSVCWQVIEQLFGYYLPDELGSIDAVQQQLQQHGKLPLPELLACGSQTADAPAFMLNRFVEGQMLTAERLTDEMISQLASHTASLHAYTSNRWGDVTQPEYDAESWPEALLKTLVRQAGEQGIAEPWLPLVVSQIDLVNPTQFAPIMLDNRWDQYLFEAGQITALVDIDAFVAGPPEIELILLEYQLTQQQADVFARSYQQVLPLPDLTDVRLCYRFLLFLMNALGETDLDTWMQHPTHW